MIIGLLAEAIQVLVRALRREEEPETRRDSLGASGWLLWYNPYSSTAISPRDYPYVWIMREEWSAPHLVDPNGLHPLMNVIGLYWCPAEAEASGVAGPAMSTSYRVH